MHPKVSVLIPTFNAGLYLRESIESVFNQSFQNFEIIVVDDDSTDDTLDILRSYQDDRIILIQGEKKGISAALNIGIKKAKGEYIARMDADDVMDSKRLEKQVHLLDNQKNISMCSTNMLTTEDWILQHGVNTPIEIRTILLFACCICHPTVMFRRELFVTNNLFYNETLKGTEDFELWQRVSEMYDIVNIPETLMTYRIHPSQSSNQLERDKILIFSYGPNFIKKHLGVELPIKYYDLIISYSIPTYSIAELHELHDILIQILDALKTYPKYSFSLARYYLFNSYKRLVTNNLSSKEIKKLMRANGPSSLYEASDFTQRKTIQDYIKKILPVSMINLLTKIKNIILGS